MLEGTGQAHTQMCPLHAGCLGANRGSDAWPDDNTQTLRQVRTYTSDSRHTTSSLHPECLLATSWGLHPFSSSPVLCPPTSGCSRASARRSILLHQVSGIGPLAQLGQSAVGSGPEGNRALPPDTADGSLYSCPTTHWGSWRGSWTAEGPTQR